MDTTLLQATPVFKSLHVQDIWPEFTQPLLLLDGFTVQFKSKISVTLFTQEPSTESDQLLTKVSSGLLTVLKTLILLFHGTELGF